MRFFWLAVVGVGLAGIVLYIVAAYDYSHWLEIGGSPRSLRGWSSFYHEHNIALLAAPLVIIGIGVVGYRRGPLIWESILPVLRRNSIASIAITLSIINFGLLMWQVSPGDSSEVTPRFSAPTRYYQDNVSRQELDQLRFSLQGEISRLQNCINGSYLSC